MNNFKFEINKTNVKFLIKNKIGIKFDTIEKLIETSKQINNLGFYTCQSRIDLKILVVYKNYKTCVLNKSVLNFTGKIDINNFITL